MRMTNASMYARVLAGDPADNGRFFFGVTTTGIYCLPACKARKPKPGNVRFFPSCEAARAAGLRPCRKCHPDDFARGADPVLESIEALVAEIRSGPAAFPDVAAIVRRSGFGSTRLFELFRQHYHTTPSDQLLRARLDVVRQALRHGTESLANVAAAAGFESLSVLHAQFRRFQGVTPAAYRAMRNGRTFELELPEDYPLPYLRRALGRDPESLTERLAGNVYTAAVHVKADPALLTMEMNGRRLSGEISSGSGLEAHALAVSLTGLDQDAGGFVRLAHRLGLKRLVQGRPGLRIAQTHSVFDGLLWSIIGQQINFAFACTLKRRLTLLAGQALGNGLYASPTPASVAALQTADLRPLQFSRQKADYLINAARLAADRTLDLGALRAMSATRAERTLLAIRGLGPWSVNYVMMRALGFPDCLPLGDTGVTSGLQALLKLDEPPDVDATRRLMAMFAPHRSLATAHLWQFNRPEPA